MTAYRRVAAVAVAALLISGVTAPVALAATPDRAPVAATVAPSPDTPINGGLLNLDLSAGLDLGAHGIVVAAVDGALDASVSADVNADAGVALKVRKGSKITHKNGKIVSGKILLKGGLKLAVGKKSLLVTGLAVDVRTGLITAKVGAKANVKIGAVANPASIEVVSEEGTKAAVVKMGNDGIVVGADLVAAIDARFGTCVRSNIVAVADLGVDAAINAGVLLNTNVLLDADVNLDADLAVALGLDLDLDLDLGLDIFAGLNLL
ncbi:hypothetical protein P8605_26620 [Streptomyces sp. T-3]|nr:hypothetical protein [Streptomyces sp. T-3]